MNFKKKNVFQNQKNTVEAAYTTASEVENELGISSAISEDDQHIEEERKGEGILESEQDKSTSSTSTEFSSQIEQIQAQAKEYLEGWQRTQAEFANYKKRMEREQVNQRQYAVATAVRRYLPVLDDLERALNNVPQTCQELTWVEGINLIYQKMVAALDADEVKPIGEVGDIFDPNIHEAIGQSPSEDYPSGSVIELIQKGYKIGERVLRPAMVRVAQ